MRALAVELARHKIRVNSILPGWIVTEMTEQSVHNPKFAGAVLLQAVDRGNGGVARREHWIDDDHESLR